MKLIKTWVRGSLIESSLSHLMKIAIETEDKLTDSDLEAIVDIRNRKGREWLFNFFISYLDFGKCFKN